MQKFFLHNLTELSNGVEVINSVLPIGRRPPNNKNSSISDSLLHLNVDPIFIPFAEFKLKSAPNTVELKIINVRKLVTHCLLLMFVTGRINKSPVQRPAKSKIFNPNPTRKKFLLPETRPEFKNFSLNYDLIMINKSR